MPNNASNYLDRTKKLPGMAEPIVELFKENCFPIWGGNWNIPKDYHHFQTSRLTAIILANTSYNVGKKFFEYYINNYNTIHKITDLEILDKIKYLLAQDSEKFMSKFYQNASKLHELDQHQFINLLY